MDLKKSPDMFNFGAILAKSDIPAITTVQSGGQCIASVIIIDFTESSCLYS